MAAADALPELAKPGPPGASAPSVETWAADGPLRFRGRAADRRLALKMPRGLDTRRQYFKADYKKSVLDDCTYPPGHGMKNSTKDHLRLPWRKKQKHGAAVGIEDLQMPQLWATCDEQIMGVHVAVQGLLAASLRERQTESSSGRTAVIVSRSALAELEMEERSLTMEECNAGIQACFGELHRQRAELSGELVQGAADARQLESDIEDCKSRIGEMKRGIHRQVLLRDDFDHSVLDMEEQHSKLVGSSKDLLDTLHRRRLHLRRVKNSSNDNN